MSTPDTPRTTPELPQDIVDLIIDDVFLESDKPTLYVCSLVSQSWMASSRRYALRPASLYHANAMSFLELFQSPHCTLGLACSAEIGIFALDFVKRTDIGTVWLNAALALPQSTFTFVSSIRLLNTYGYTASLEVIAKIPLVFTHIKSLELSCDIEPCSFTNFTQFLCSFSCLESLKAPDFERPTFRFLDEELYALQALPSPPPKLSRLDVVGEGLMTKSILSWFQTVTPPYRVTSLRLMVLRSPNPVVEAYLRQTSGTLTEFELIDEFNGLGGLSRHVNWSASSALTKFKLFCSKSASSEVITILSAMRALPIQHLYIYSFKNVALLDSLLELPHFGMLQHLYLWCMNNSDAWRAECKARLPMCSQRGIIRFLS